MRVVTTVPAIMRSLTAAIAYAGAISPLNSWMYVMASAERHPMMADTNAMTTRINARDQQTRGMTLFPESFRILDAYAD